MGAIHLRIATYNVHKCRGVDRTMNPERIARILKTLDADVIGLQEVLDVRTGSAKLDQARRLAEFLPEYVWGFGANRSLHGGRYGNMTLSRFPMQMSLNYALPQTRREARGCLRTDLRVGSLPVLHAFNLHLGTGFMERRSQARYLLKLLETEASLPRRIIFGDFNEWTRGLASRSIADAFQTFDPASTMKSARTYPGLLPLLHLDHFYYDPDLRLKKIELIRNRATLVASDHLPLVAEFSVSMDDRLPPP